MVAKLTNIESQKKTLDQNGVHSTYRMLDTVVARSRIPKTMSENTRMICCLIDQRKPEVVPKIVAPRPVREKVIWENQIQSWPPTNWKDNATVNNTKHDHVPIN